MSDMVKSLGITGIVGINQLMPRVLKHTHMVHLGNLEIVSSPLWCVRVCVCVCVRELWEVWVVNLLAPELFFFILSHLYIKCE